MRVKKLYSIKFFRIKNKNENSWILYDGAGQPDKRSTNGTWVYVDDNFRLYDSVVFRGCNYLFTVQI